MTKHVITIRKELQVLKHLIFCVKCDFYGMVLSLFPSDFVPNFTDLNIALAKKPQMKFPNIHRLVVQLASSSPKLIKIGSVLAKLHKILDSVLSLFPPLYFGYLIRLLLLVLAMS